MVLLSQDSRYPGRELNLGLSEYEAEVLAAQLSFLMVYLRPFQQILPRRFLSTFFLFYCFVIIPSFYSVRLWLNIP
jgi:uncharacterized membrane protein